MVNRTKYGVLANNAAYWNRTKRMKYSPNIMFKRHKFRNPLYRPRKSFRTGLNVRTGGVIGVDVKYIDESLHAFDLPIRTAGSMADPATMDCLNGVDTGNSITTRIGTKIQMLSVLIEGTVYLDTQKDINDSLKGDWGRIILFLDKQTNGVIADPTTVYLDQALNGVCGLRDPEYMERYKVLNDWRFQLDYTVAFTDGVNTGTQQGQAKNFRFWRKMKIPVKYTGDGATVAVVMDNSLHLMAVCFAGHTLLSYHSRVRFIG